MMGHLNKVNKRENNRGKFRVQRIINSVFMHIFWTKPIQSRTLWPSNIIEIKT
jgi:hypothetical protein